MGVEGAQIIDQTTYRFPHVHSSKGKVARFGDVCLEIDKVFVQ